MGQKDRGSGQQHGACDIEWGLEGLPAEEGQQQGTPGRGNQDSVALSQEALGLLESGLMYLESKEQGGMSWWERATRRSVPERPVTHPCNVLFF